MSLQSRDDADGKEQGVLGGAGGLWVTAVFIDTVCALDSQFQCQVWLDHAAMLVKREKKGQCDGAGLGDGGLGGCRLRVPP